MKLTLTLAIIVLGSLSGCSTLWTNADSVRELSPDAQIKRAIRQQEVTLGMRMNDVEEVWGTPQEVQTAGDPELGNQKWIYYSGLSSRWSLSDARVIYFESGRVAGWESAQR